MDLLVVFISYLILPRIFYRIFPYFIYYFIFRLCSTTYLLWRAGVMTRTRDRRPCHSRTLWTKSIPDTLQVQKEKTKTPANPVTNESRTGMKILKWYKN